MVTASAADATLTLPATSVALVVMLRMPLARAEVVTLHDPSVSDATAVPTLVAPLKIVIVLPCSAVPVKVGVLLLVMLSVLDTPVSDAAVISGTDGAGGTAVSMVTAKAADGALRLPDLSVAVAVML